MRENYFAKETNCNACGIILGGGIEGHYVKMTLEACMLMNSYYTAILFRPGNVKS